MPRRLEDIRSPLPPLDGRTYVARELKRFRAGLLKQLGPHLTPLQAAQLELAISLKRQLLEWDCAYGNQGRDASLHDTRTTLGWIGASLVAVLHRTSKCVSCGVLAADVAVRIPSPLSS